MKTAAQAVTQALSSASRRPSEGAEHTAVTQTQTSLSAELCDLLWARMVARYGHRWIAHYGDSPDGLAGAEWRETLTGVTREMLREGFRRDAVRGDDWPPSSTKFRALCFAVPSFAEIERLVRPGCSATTPFARLVMGCIDGWEFQRADFDKARRMVQDAYALARDHVLSGGELPDDPVAYIPDMSQRKREFTERDVAAGAAELERLKAQLGIDQ